MKKTIESLQEQLDKLEQEMSLHVSDEGVVYNQFRYDYLHMVREAAELKSSIDYLKSISQSILNPHNDYIIKKDN